ncbi:hypothetical protein Pfo_031457, partial [Paulownia fortunei]
NIRGVRNEGSQKHPHIICQLNRIKLLVLLEPMLLHIEISSKLIASPILVTSMYAKCNASDRKELRDELRTIADELDFKPWLVGGDFNVILDPHEKKGNSILNTTAMNDFGDMITNCGLIDAGFEGSASHGPTKEFGRDLTEYFTRTHGYMPFSRPNFSSVKPPSSFRFMRIWTRHHLFLDKLIRLKKFLKWWNWNVFGDILDKIKQAQNEVVKAETTFDDTPTEATQFELNRCTVVLTHALTLEEDFWRQKAACRWVDQGERNSKFFHSLDITTSAAEFFQSLLSDNIDALLDDSLGCLERLPTTFCPESLCSAPNMEEIRHAVFDMDSDSVVGPDGFSTLFFQHCWDFIQEDVRDAIEDFFSGTPMPRSFTATSLVLIPKTDSPNTWNDFRPISLCYITNKIITKLLSLRLAKLLPDLIAPSQSGFVQGRLISDNILLAQELIHSIDSRQVQDNVVFKLDMAKAYDRVQWGFLYKVLQNMGFSASWISYVRHCIENYWFTVLINGVPTGFFKSSRGLRQGDPISPLLVVLAANFLSWGLDALFREHEDMYYRNQALRLTHLSYADDIIIFSNCEKACLIRLMEFLTFTAKYQGSALTSTRALLLAGKKPLFLMEVGLLSLKAHFPRCHFTSSRFYIPKMVIHTIEQIMARFFWGSTGAQKRMHWTSWNTICSPVEESGLGIRKIEHVVKAFSLKLWWRFRTTTSLWASYMLQKYCRGFFPGKVKLSVHDSPIWKRLCGVRNEAQDNMFWTLGDGEVSFWHDHWMGEGPLIVFRGEEQHGHERSAPRHLVDLICGVSISCDRRDTAVWKLTTHGDFSIASAWESMRQGRGPYLTPTMSVFLWRLAHDWIPADFRLQRKGLQLASKCQCCSSLESIQHIFISGDCAKEVWEHFANTFHIRLPFTKHPAILIQSWKLSTPFSNTTHIRTIIPLLILWFLWTERNDSKHRNTGYYPSRVIWKVHNHLYLLFKCRKLTSTLWRGDLGIAARLGYHFIIGKTKKTIHVHWAKPQSGWFKLNTDGASRGTEGNAGAGGIIRDHLGDHILAFQDFIGPASSIFSELYALNRGLQLALIRGITHLWIEIDALARLQQLLVDIKNVLHHMTTSITHIYREGNRVADFLANATCDTTSSRTFTAEELSGHILGFIRLDQLGTPSFRHHWHH